MNTVTSDLEEKSGYFDQKGSQLFYSVHAAAEPVALAVLAGPFATERVTTYAPWVRWARFLARNGITALTFDYRGVGESTGAFETLSVGDWMDDLDLCTRWLREQNPGLPLLQHGLGFGGLLAAQAFQRGSGNALLLWSPLTKGDQAIREALLRRMSFDLVQAGAEGPKGATDYLAELDHGKPVSIEGYLVTTRLWKDCGAMRLTAANSDQPATGQPGSGPCRIVKLKQTEVPLVAGSGLWQALNPRARMRRCPLNPDFGAFFGSNLEWIKTALTITNRSVV